MKFLLFTLFGALVFECKRMYCVLPIRASSPGGSLAPRLSELICMREPPRKEFLNRISYGKRRDTVASVCAESAPSPGLACIRCPVSLEAGRPCSALEIGVGYLTSGGLTSDPQTSHRRGKRTNNWPPSRQPPVPEHHSDHIVYTPFHTQCAPVLLWPFSAWLTARNSPSVWLSG